LLGLLAVQEAEQQVRGRAGHRGLLALEPERAGESHLASVPVMTGNTGLEEPPSAHSASAHPASASLAPLLLSARFAPSVLSVPVLPVPVLPVPELLVQPLLEHRAELVPLEPSVALEPSEHLALPLEHLARVRLVPVP